MRLAGLLLLWPGTAAPNLSSLSPSTATAGDAAFWLTVAGSDFVPGSIVRVDGADRTTTFLLPTKVAASITASDISRVGVKHVTVYSPSGGSSSSLPLTVVAPPPAPTLISIAPATVTAGGPEFQLTVTGSDFAPTSLIEIDGVTRPTFDGTATTLTTLVSASERNSPGSRRIRVRTPAPGGGASEYVELKISPRPQKAKIPGPQKAQIPGPQKAQISQTGSQALSRLLTTLSRLMLSHHQHQRAFARREFCGLLGPAG